MTKVLEMLESQVFVNVAMKSEPAELKVDEGSERKKRHSGTAAPIVVSSEGMDGKKVDLVEEEKGYHSGSDGPSSPDPSSLSPSIRSCFHKAGARERRKKVSLVLTSTEAEAIVADARAHIGTPSPLKERIVVPGEEDTPIDFGKRKKLTENEGKALKLGHKLVDEDNDSEISSIQEDTSIETTSSTTEPMKIDDEQVPDEEPKRERRRRRSEESEEGTEASTPAESNEETEDERRLRRSSRRERRQAIQAKLQVCICKAILSS